MLISANENINNRSLNHLPPSSKSYFKRAYGTSYGRYNVDFINQFFGIKHLHLHNDRKQDVLLYYIVYQTQIYFLKIGTHTDLFEQDIIQNLVIEFPDLIEYLGIASLPDMPVNDYRYLLEDVRNIWQSGGNVSYVINNKYFTSRNVQTLSLLNSKAVWITSNILYQAHQQFTGFTDHLKNLYTNFNCDFEIVPLVYDRDENVVELGSLITKDSCEIKIDYLEKLRLIDSYLVANVVK